MTSSNHPENQNSHTARDLGQININNDTPWVIVTEAGTDKEGIWSEHETYKAAIQSAIREIGGDFMEIGFDIMKRNKEGTLTTEF